MIQVQVPAEVERGRNAVLGCRFELEGDTLYSVKWYKGNYKHTGLFLLNVFISLAN